MLERVNRPNHKTAILRDVAEFRLDSVYAGRQTLGAISTQSEIKIQFCERAFPGPNRSTPFIGKTEWDIFGFGSLSRTTNEFFPRFVDTFFLFVMASLSIVALFTFANPPDTIISLVIFYSSLSCFAIYFIVSFAIFFMTFSHLRVALFSVSRMTRLIGAIRRAIQLPVDRKSTWLVEIATDYTCFHAPVIPVNCKPCNS